MVGYKEGAVEIILQLIMISISLRTRLMKSLTMLWLA